MGKGKMERKLRDGQVVRTGIRGQRLALRVPLSVLSSEEEEDGDEDGEVAMVKDETEDEEEVVVVEVVVVEEKGRYGETRRGEQ